MNYSKYDTQYPHSITNCFQVQTHQATRIYILLVVVVVVVVQIVVTRQLVQ